MVELVEKFLDGIEGAETSLLVTSSTVVVAESYIDKFSSYTPHY